MIVINKGAFLSIHPLSIVSYPKNVFAGVDICPGYNPGCYIHAVNRIYIGDYTQIGPNMGLMSGNHDLYAHLLQLAASPIVIGNHCWIGMGIVILPEVVLGDFTIVGAGSIVTHSFPEGHCVIVGNPPKKIKDLDEEKCIPFNAPNQYLGYVPKAKFEEFKNKHLNI